MLLDVGDKSLLRVAVKRLVKQVVHSYLKKIRH